MSTYALVKSVDNTVVNILQWDGDTEVWQPPAEHLAIQITNEIVWIGGTYVDSVFSPPIDNTTLEEAKQKKRQEIDKKTEELIDLGFSFNSKQFSLSAHAQSYWNGLGNLIANNLLVEPDNFPLPVNTLNDLEVYDISSIAEALMFFATASATIKGHLESGTALKTQVRAATTFAEVAAVVDDRMSIT